MHSVQVMILMIDSREVELLVMYLTFDANSDVLHSHSWLIRKPWCCMLLSLGMPLLSRKEEVAVYSDRPYKKFEQVFINYGEKGNGDLLLLYGFALDRNPFDSVDIAVGLSQEDPLYGRKKAFLEKAGRGRRFVVAFSSVYLALSIFTYLSSAQIMFQL